MKNYPHILSYLALSLLAACGGGGGGGSPSTASSDTNQPKIECNAECQAGRKAAEESKAETERKAAEEAEKAKVEAERNAAEEAEKAKAEAERKAAEEAEKAKAEAERKAAEEAEKAKVEAERKAAEEAAKAKAEAERKAAAEAEKAKAEAEHKAAEEAEKAKAEAERKAAEEAEKAKAEAESKAAEEAEKAKAERKAAEEAEKAKAEAERKAAEEVAKTKAEVERKAAEEAEKAKAEAERKAAEEAEKAKVEAERKAAEEAAKAKAEADRKAAEEAEKAKAEAEPKAAEEVAVTQQIDGYYSKISQSGIEGDDISHTGDINVLELDGQKISLVPVSTPQRAEAFGIDDDKFALVAATHLKYGRYGSYGLKNEDGNLHTSYTFYQGIITPEAAMPQEGQAFYRGYALYSDVENTNRFGNSIFMVDFGLKSLSGAVYSENGEFDEVKLEGQIAGNRFFHVDEKEQKIMSGMFLGPQAEELTGRFDHLLESKNGTFGAAVLKD